MKILVDSYGQRKENKLVEMGQNVSTQVIAGIGFKALREFNLALLANRVAVLMRDSSSLL